MCLVKKAAETNVQMRNFNTVVDTIKMKKIKKQNYQKYFFSYGNNRLDTAEIRISFKTVNRNDSKYNSNWEKRHRTPDISEQYKMI